LFFSIFSFLTPETNPDLDLDFWHWTLGQAGEF
jgi:hypothetical protein